MAECDCLWILDHPPCRVWIMYGFRYRRELVYPLPVSQASDWHPVWCIAIWCILLYTQLCLHKAWWPQKFGVTITLTEAVHSQLFSFAPGGIWDNAVYVYLSSCLVYFSLSDWCTTKCISKTVLAWWEHRQYEMGVQKMIFGGHRQRKKIF